MALSDLFSKFRERKEKFRQMQEDFRLQRMLEEREKSADERELEKIIEKKRQERITNTLKKIRRQETHSFFGNKDNILKAKNVFKHKPTILNQDRNILEDGKNQFLNSGSFF